MLTIRKTFYAVTVLISLQFALAGSVAAGKPDKPPGANKNQPQATCSKSTTSTSSTSANEGDCCSKCLVDGRFTGGGGQIVDGVRITRGLTLHCDLKLSNNLQINWQGNRFHMEEHLVTVACFDDPNIHQAPPRAPLDTLRGRGVGRFNGVDGYRVRFVLVDGGEPGRRDMMEITIIAPDGEIVLDVPKQFLTHGNLQAHADQPHRSR